MYLRLSEGTKDEPSRFGPQAIGWGQGTASTVFRGRERVLVRESGLGKPQLLTGEAGVLPLACPAVDGDGKKANVREATPGLSALGIRAGKHALVTNVRA